MPLWGRRAAALSLDEFVGEGEARAPSCLDLSAASAEAWQRRLGARSRSAAAPTSSELALTAFTLIRGGDHFERPPSKRARTEPKLLDAYAAEQLRVAAHGASSEVAEAAVGGVLRVLAGNPAVAKRMLLARPLRLVIVPKGHDFRRYAFPRHTNPQCAGVFWNDPRDEAALLGLREERILEKPWLMVHEMTHAVHFLAFTAEEREALERMLLPVYGSRRWVDEAVAIYAERAFGANYSPEDLAAPGLYGQTRRDWSAQHVFAKFVEALFLPARPTPKAR